MTPHYQRTVKVTLISNYFFSSLANVIICENKTSTEEKDWTALSSFLSFLQMKNQILNYADEGFSQQFQHHENNSHHS